MPFKNPQSGYYYTQLKLDGYGTLSRLSLGTKRKTEARHKENAIKTLYQKALVDPRLFQILDAVQGRGHGRSGNVTPAHILIAQHQEGGYEKLLLSLSDPLVSEVIKAYMSSAPGITRQEGTSFKNILKHLGEKRFSGLQEPGVIQELLETIEQKEEKQRNSVIRYEKRALSKLIRWKLGKVDRDRIFQNVEYTSDDDRRRLRASVITNEAIGKLLNELDNCYFKEGDECASLYVEIAITTGATIRPLSESINANLERVLEGEREWGRLYLEGTKQIKRDSSRDRYIWILPHLFERVKPYWNPEGQDERIFPLFISRFDTIWQRARKKAGLMNATLDGKPLRPHDCRRIFSMRAEEAGIPRTKISQGGLGHQRLEQTDDYLIRDTMLTPSEMGKVLQAYAPKQKVVSKL